MCGVAGWINTKLSEKSDVSAMSAAVGVIERVLECSLPRQVDNEGP